MDHVLIADDDADIRSVTRLILADARYAVTEAADGNAMLRLLKTAPSPWVVLMDFGLFPMDNAALLRLLLLARSRTQHHAYVLFTAQSPQSYAPLLPLLEQLAMQRLAKPFDIDELLATVAQAAARLPMAITAPLSIHPH